MYLLLETDLTTFPFEINLPSSLTFTMPLNNSAHLFSLAFTSSFNVLCMCYFLWLTLSFFALLVWNMKGMCFEGMLSSNSIIPKVGQTSPLSCVFDSKCEALHIISFFMSFATLGHLFLHCFLLALVPICSFAFVFFHFMCLLYVDQHVPSLCF
jgi:hypothetical protein